MVRKLAVALSVLAMALVSVAGAAEKATIGEPAPQFQGLQGADGKSYTLADYKGKNVVVVFTCNQCPVAVDFENDFIEFSKDYQGKDVQLVAINVSSSENLAAAKARAEEKGFNFPYVRDESQEVAKAYGARVTPHVYIVDKDGKLAYTGAFSDNKRQNNYVRDAVDALLAGKKVEVSTTKEFGCGIKWGK